MNKKILTLESIDKKIKDLETIKKGFEKILSIESITLLEKVAMQYIKCQKVVDTADYLNKNGFRVGERKYISNDITKIITSSTGETEGEKLLLSVAKAIYKIHIASSNQNLLIKIFKEMKEGSL